MVNRYAGRYKSYVERDANSPPNDYYRWFQYTLGRWISDILAKGHKVLIMDQVAYPEALPSILSHYLGLTDAQIKKCIILGGPGRESRKEIGWAPQQSEHIEQALHMVNKEKEGEKRLENQDVVLLTSNDNCHGWEFSFAVERAGSQVLKLISYTYDVPGEQRGLYDRITKALEKQRAPNNGNVPSSTGEYVAAGAGFKIDL